LGWLQDRFFFIRAEDESPTIDWIIETARAAVMRHGINGLIIDPYNEIEHRRSPGQTETEYVSEILSKIKRFAQAHGVHVWFVAHPAKLYRGQDGRLPLPTLYDISGSANWVNKADVGVVVARDLESNRVDIHIKKVRWKEVGRQGTASLEFDRVTGRYSDSETVQWRSAG
jgi:twinkle protein